MTPADSTTERLSLPAIQAATRRHRQHHGCGAYTFEDGDGLTALARAYHVARALELGTALGYTACCLAAASDATHVDTIEWDAEHVALAEDNIRAAGLADRITVHRGDFAPVLDRLVGPYDLAFFDGFAPDRAIVRRLHALLDRDGLLVCANLGLATGAGARDLADELGDGTRWTPVDPIERGATRVYRRN